MADVGIDFFNLFAGVEIAGRMGEYACGDRMMNLTDVQKLNAQISFDCKVTMMLPGLDDVEWRNW